MSFGLDLHPPNHTHKHQPTQTPTPTPTRHSESKGHAHWAKEARGTHAERGKEPEAEILLAKRQARGACFAPQLQPQRHRRHSHPLLVLGGRQRRAGKGARLRRRGNGERDSPHSARAPSCRDDARAPWRMRHVALRRPHHTSYTPVEPGAICKTPHASVVRSASDPHARLRPGTTCSTCSVSSTR